jgi:hypothetical protein
MIRRVLTLSALALGALFLAPEAQATTITPLSVEQMTDASELIVRATVQEIWVEKAEDGRIWTMAQLEVDQVLKGDVETSFVVVSQLGGVHRNEFAMVSGAPRFSVGEDGVFFLESTAHGARTSVVGWWQGKLTVRQEPHTGREMLVRFEMTQNTPYDHRFLPHPPADQRVYLEDFEAKVLDRVEAGWDGESIPGVSDDKLARINNVQGVQ